MQRRLFTVLLAGALALAGCENPSGGSGTPRITDPPETAGREVAPGQTVSESLESATDVDRFALTIPRGGAGMVLFKGTGTNTGQGALSLALFDSSSPGAGLLEVTAHGTNESAVRFRLPAGRWMVQVKSAGGTGPYAFAIHSIDAGREEGDSVLPLRQWVHGALDPYYDTDEFVFDGVQGQELSLYMNVEAQGGLVDMVVRAPGQTEEDTLFVARSESFTRGAHLEPFRLPATGRYRVSLTTPDPVERGFGGPYRIMLFPVVPAPEHVPSGLQHGVPIGEDLDMDDDVDEYTFTAVKGEMFQFFFDVPAGSTIAASMVDPLTGQTLPQDGDGESHAPRGIWRRWAAPRDGDFTIRVTDGQGDYAVELFRIDTLPETIPTAITLGQTVQGESIFPSEDVDTYTFSGTAGTRIVMMVDGPAGSFLELLAPGGDTPVLRQLVAFGDVMEDHTSIRYTLPATGTYRVRMAHHAEQNTGIARDPLGPYQFRVAAVNYAPESVHPGIQIGQTVTGESLEHRGDVDVFAFSAREGDRLTLWGDKQPLALTDGIVMTIQAPGPEVVPPLAYIWPTGVMWNGTFVVPQTGVYEVRVFASSTTSWDPANMSTFRGAYQLAVRRAD